MGCQASKSKSSFSTSGVDDSIHAMFKRERRQAAKNGEHFGYRPPAPLPTQMKLKKVILCEEEEEEDSKTVDTFTPTSA
jgi:hypothetical protein